MKIVTLRYLFLQKKGEEQTEAFMHVITLPENEIDAFEKARFFDNDEIVRVSREILCYYDADEVGKITWIKNILEVKDNVT